MPSCSVRMLHQCCDQHRAWTRAKHFDTCPPSWFCQCFSLAGLGFVTVVVSHSDAVPPFHILRSLRGFDESVSRVRLGRFLHQDKLSLFVVRLKPQESCLNVLERTAPLPLDDAACCCRIDAQSQLDRHALSARRCMATLTFREFSQRLRSNLRYSAQSALAVDRIATPVCIGIPFWKIMK